MTPTQGGAGFGLSFLFHFGLLLAVFNNGSGFGTRDLPQAETKVIEVGLVFEDEIAPAPVVEETVPEPTLEQTEEPISEPEVELPSVEDIPFPVRRPPNLGNPTPQVTAREEQGTQTRTSGQEGVQGQTEATGGQTSAPRILHRPQLDYPQAAKRAGREGTCQVALTVDTNGRPQNVRIQASSGHRDIDQACLRAARGHVFSPALRNGIAQAAEVILPITFSLEN